MTRPPVGQNSVGPMVRMERVPPEETQRRARVELRQMLWETPIPLDEIETFVAAVVAEIRSDEVRLENQTEASARCRCGHRHDEHETVTRSERWAGHCKCVVWLSGKRCRCEEYRPKVKAQR